MQNNPLLHGSVLESHQSSGGDYINENKSSAIVEEDASVHRMRINDRFL
jgi:hypothetical protein